MANRKSVKIFVSYLGLDIGGCNHLFQVLFFINEIKKWNEN
jgi:hypothetical protein